jgi:tight adherence protein B
MGPNNDIIVAGFAALSAALTVWCLVQLASFFLNAERNRIKRRLSADWEGSGAAQLPSSRSIVVELEMKGAPPFIARSAFFRAINRKLVHAFPEASFMRFLWVCLSMGLFSFLIGTWLMDSIPVGILALAAGAYLPMLVLNSRANKRQRILAGQLPDALEFLTRILRAGHSLSTGLHMMGDELPQPVAAEFRRCYDQHSMGQPLEYCLRDMANRVDSQDFAFFVTAVLILRQTGGDLTEVLTNICAMIRGRVRLSQKIKALTAEGRFTGYILIAFPAVLFMICYFLNPKYAGMLLHTDSGRYMLGAAFGLQIIGLIVIRRIIAVRL